MYLLFFSKTILLGEIMEKVYVHPTSNLRKQDIENFNGMFCNYNTKCIRNTEIEGNGFIEATAEAIFAIRFDDNKVAMHITLSADLKKNKVIGIADFYIGIPLQTKTDENKCFYYDTNFGSILLITMKNSFHLIIHYRPGITRIDKFRLLIKYETDDSEIEKIKAMKT